MHVMTRGVDEAIVVDGTIVRVLEIHEGQVRLGIATPNSTVPYREVTLTCDAEVNDSAYLELPVVLTAN